MLNARLVVSAWLLFMPFVSGTGFPSEASLIGTWELRGDDGVIVDIIYRADHSFIIESRSPPRRLGTGNWRVQGNDLITKVKTHMFPQLRGRHVRQPIIELDSETLKIRDKKLHRYLQARKLN
jgi:hypothetical protein